MIKLCNLVHKDAIAPVIIETILADWIILYTARFDGWIEACANVVGLVIHTLILVIYNIKLYFVVWMIYIIIVEIKQVLRWASAHITMWFIFLYAIWTIIMTKLQIGRQTNYTLWDLRWLAITLPIFDLTMGTIIALTLDKNSIVAVYLMIPECHDVSGQNRVSALEVVKININVTICTLAFVIVKYIPKWIFMSCEVIWTDTKLKEFGHTFGAFRYVVRIKYFVIRRYTYFEIIDWYFIFTRTKTCLIFEK